MSFETKNFKVLKKTKLPQTEISKECSVELEGNVDKILSSSSQVSVVNYEISEGEISFTALCDSCVIYMTEGNGLGSSNATCEFSGKISNALIQADDKAILSLSVKDESVKFENGNAIISVTIGEDVELISQTEVKNIEANDDDICTKKGCIEVEKFVGMGKVQSETSEEFSAKSNVKKIISLEPAISVKNVECENGSISVYGDTITRIVYLTTDDKFESNFVLSSFKEEIEVPDARQGMIGVCKGQANHKETTAEVVESDKGTKIVIKTPFNLEAYVFGKEDIETIEDMFSTKNEIQMASESFDMTKVCKSELLEGKIDGSLNLSEDKPRVDKIIFNGGNSISVTNAYVANKELFVEGIAKTTVVYLNDEENSLSSVEIEIPFALSDKVEANDDAVVCAEAVLFDTDVSVRKGRELFFDGKVKVNARICEDEVSATVVSAQKGDAFEDRDYAMQYVFGKAGETLWDIAKRNKVKEEQIIAQNPDAVFPLVQDDGFVLFFQKTI